MYVCARAYQQLRTLSCIYENIGSLLVIENSLVEHFQATNQMKSDQTIKYIQGLAISVHHFTPSTAGRP